MLAQKLLGSPQRVISEGRLLEAAGVQREGQLGDSTLLQRSSPEGT